MFDRFAYFACVELCAQECLALQKNHSSIQSGRLVDLSKIQLKEGLSYCILLGRPRDNSKSKSSLRYLNQHPYSGTYETSIFNISTSPAFKRNGKKKKRRGNLALPMSATCIARLAVMQRGRCLPCAWMKVELVCSACM
jgi:hypothetical protein